MNCLPVVDLENENVYSETKGKDIPQKSNKCKLPLLVLLSIISKFHILLNYIKF